ncbi:uncharacterized protein BDZ99DRAFT_518497 [Mytilinidion resinicola]|uniref:Uncharacterized protein n=1 Tax=Mytilinidion resinicola TaxID=574789 RepID=A0A6A6YXG8_9PEZI|nr:uncharacterized protein BDZ99DRAFT_518497 [Mytilinidion resinicola]KAF2812684.1 hypothetical protein BDZ99DRAFT_518497 [Mytilinidion resinicola]
MALCRAPPDASPTASRPRCRRNTVIVEHWQHHMKARKVDRAPMPLLATARSPCQAEDPTAPALRSPPTRPCKSPAAPLLHTKLDVKAPACINLLGAFVRRPATTEESPEA